MENKAYLEAIITQLKRIADSLEEIGQYQAEEEDDVVNINIGV